MTSFHCFPLLLQIYAYEINKLLQPSTRPRQIFPYAVITYTENGAYVPAVDAKPTAKEKLAGTITKRRRNDGGGLAQFFRKLNFNDIFVQNTLYTLIK